MAILTTIKDALNAKQYKFENEGLTEENRRLKNIKLTPTQMALSQILSKTKELEDKVEWYDNLIETKTKSIEGLNIEYSNKVAFQTKELEVELEGYDELIETKTKAIEDLQVEFDYQTLSQTREFEKETEEYDKLIVLKCKDLKDKSSQYNDLIEKEKKEYDDLIQLKGNELEYKLNEYGILIEAKTKSLEALNLEYTKVKTCVDNLKSQIVTLDDDISMQSFGIYKHKYSLLKSENFSTMLMNIRENQIELIKSKEAIEYKQWIVNGSFKEDNQLMDDASTDMINLVVRIFNDECDSIIDKVTFSNVEIIENIIKKFFEDLNKLGNITQVKIAPKYFNTKLEELYLTYEFNLKKQQEKEEHSRMRE